MGILGGAGGDGGTDCHSQCAHWLRNDTLQVVRWAGRRGRRPLRKCILWCVGEGLCPSHGRPQGSPLRMDCKRCGGRAVGDAGPYGRVTGGAMGGRPQGSPLRKGCKRCGVRAVGDAGPYGGTRGATGGRPQGSPLRRVTRSDCVRGRAAALHQGSFLQRSSVLWTTWATLWPRPG